jgi:putative DNA methylase
LDIKRDKYGRPRVYLEEDCPVEELSVESQRERGASSALPPLYFLHVWWARRPLTVSRASILGSLLPAGYDRTAFLELMGVPRGKNPMDGRRRISNIRAGVEKDPGGDLYGFKRAFSNNVPPSAIGSMRKALSDTWGGRDLVVLDAFAGGGSIPFESLRMGFNTIANELNPVASVIERATLDYPKTFGPELAKDIIRIGETIASQLERDLKDYFPRVEDEVETDYIWVRTIRCPKCELSVPLAPNWWLDSKDKIAYRPIVPKMGESDVCSFKIVQGSGEFDPASGSVKRGIGTCPRCGNIIDGDTIKQEGNAGNLGNQLAAILSFRIEGRRRVKRFRPVERVDIEGFERASEALKKKLPDWQMRGLVPVEEIPEGKETKRVHEYGMKKWYQMFNDRQLLVHLTTLEAILNYPWNEVKNEKKREALRVYLQLAMDKTLDYNSLQSRLHSSRMVMVNTFDRHDFAFKWSYGEIDGAGNLFRFGYSQIADAYSGIEKLLSGSTGYITFINGDASNLSDLDTSSINLVSIDPPYYDNVMYSECSDYFYVWMKRGLGDVFPELFSCELTDKTTEAVANPAQFKGLGRGKATKLAAQDYEAKMLSAFKEMHRVLRDDGVMTVMFTHKKVEAWDTMAHALLDAGFMITASWPIHTESEHSLHQAKKNAAASTILLVCRKRPVGEKTSWWDEVQTRVDDEVRRKAEEFAAKGLQSQDISIACFGPALQVISENWPVKRKDGTVIRPEEALDRARTIVSSWFMDRIAEGKAEELDTPTRYYILAWYMFGAREFRFDEARKLGLSLNIEVEELIRRKLLQKKGDYVKFLTPWDRAKNRGLRTDVKEYDSIVDLVQAAMYAYSEGQSAELKLFYQRTGALAVKGYEQAIGYLLDVLPRTAEVKEYAILNDMWEANPGNIRRKVRNTDPTGEKQSKLAQFDADEGESDEELDEMDDEMESDEE